MYTSLVSGGSFAAQNALLLFLDITYVLGGTYLLLKLDTILPRYRSELVRLITIGFGLNVLLYAWTTLQIILYPEMMLPGFSEGDLTLPLLAIPIAGMALMYLVYRVTVNSIDTVSKREPDTHRSTSHTILYWAIAIGFFVAMLIAILWDPATNSFNVL